MTNPYLALNVKRAHGIWSRFSGFVDFLFGFGAEGMCLAGPCIVN
jgi:hypothetical protein